MTPSCALCSLVRVWFDRQPQHLAILLLHSQQNACSLQTARPCSTCDILGACCVLDQVTLCAAEGQV